MTKTAMRSALTRSRSIRTEKDNYVAGPLARELAPLARTAEDRRRARHALLGLLARETNADTAERLADGLARLDPTAHDLRT